METVAVYWEPVIKTYGFKTIADVSLIQIVSDDLAAMGGLIRDLESITNAFTLLWHDDHTFGLCLGMAGENRGRCVEHIREKCMRANIDFTQTIDPVSVVYFHGPHYGDRYGIAETVFQTLRGKVNPLASAFSGATVYLVFSPDQADAAIELLSQAFETPEKDHA